MGASLTLTSHTPLIKGVEAHPLNSGCQKPLVLKCFLSPFGSSCLRPKTQTSPISPFFEFTKEKLLKEALKPWSETMTMVLISVSQGVGVDPGLG